MSDGLVCDGCGEPLLLESDVRYVVEIAGRAAYDPLEITRQELETTDYAAEMARLLASMEGLDAERLESDVHREFRFDLCRPCWLRYIEDPLGMLRTRERGGASRDEDAAGPDIREGPYPSA